MSYWTYDNNKDVQKSFSVVLTDSLNDRVTIRVRQNTKTWRWEPEIFSPRQSNSLEIPADRNLSARTPTRAAAKAVEYLLELADHDELPR